MILDDKPSGHDPECWANKGEDYTCTCQSFGDAPNWQNDSVQREHSPLSNIKELMDSFEIELISYNIIAPFAHDPKNKYVAATVYRDERREWGIKGYGARFKTSFEATLWYAQLLESQRAAMLDEEFKNSGI